MTDEERRTPFVLWDDASLGRACKCAATILGDATGESAVKYTAAAMLLVNEAVVMGITKARLELGSIADQLPGDWSITVEYVDNQPGERHAGGWLTVTKPIVRIPRPAAD